MAIAFTLATSGFRKNGVKLPYQLNKLTGFNAFWYSHHLLAIVYVLLIFHGYYVILVHKWYKKTVGQLLLPFFHLLSYFVDRNWNKIVTLQRDDLVVLSDSSYLLFLKPDVDVHSRSIAALFGRTISQVPSIRILYGQDFEGTHPIIFCFYMHF